MLRLEPRKELSRTMFYLTPVLALALTIIAGAILFAFLGKDPGQAIFTIFLGPLTTFRGFAELLVKATPLSSPVMPPEVVTAFDGVSGQ